MSQSVLANVSDVSCRTIAGLEKNETASSVSETIKAIAAALDVDYDELIVHPTETRTDRSQTADNIAEKIREEIQNRKTSDGKLRDASEDLQVAIAMEAWDKSRQEIRRIVGTLTERFGATSAWLFFVSEDENRNVKSLDLDEDLSHNTPMLDVLDNKIWKGIVFDVAEKNCPYLTNDVSKDDLYDPTNPETKSELAAPILYYDADGLERRLGVLNLESNREGAFFDCQTGDLQAAVTELVPHMLILSHVEQGEVAWHPSVHGWTLEQILSRFCNMVTETAKREKSRMDGCTIWYRDGDRLCPRGTAKFDYDYLSGRTLPADRSVTGDALTRTKDALPVETKVAEDRFHEKDKAQRMGLSSVVSAPIFRPDIGEAVGVLNLYVYNNKHEHAKRIHNKEILELARDIGRIISCCQKLQHDVAAANLVFRLTERRLPGVSDFAVLREVLMECFDADACSIFAPALTDPQNFVCVTTTGLLQDGVPVSDTSTAQYNFEDTRDQGLTYAIFLKPNGVVRLSSVANSIEREKVIGSKHKPVNLYQETFVISETDHRPFLGFKIVDDATTVGIARVLRSSRSRLFVKADEDLALRLGKLASRYFDRRDNDTIHRSTDIRNEPAFAHLDDLDERAAQRAEPAATRIMQKLPTSFCWNRVFIESVLKDLMTVFNHEEAIVASVRFPDHAAGDLGVYAQHSAYSLDPLIRKKTDDDDVVFKSFGKTAVDRKQLLTFDRLGLKEYSVHHGDDNAINGIRMPVMILTGNGHHAQIRSTVGVLSVDFAKLIAWDSNNVQAMQLAAQKISMLGSNNRIAYPRYPVRKLIGALNAIEQLTCQKIDAFMLRQTNGEEKVISESHPEKIAQEWCEDTLEPICVGPFGPLAEYGPENRAIRLRLPIGFFDSQLEFRGIFRQQTDPKKTVADDINITDDYRDIIETILHLHWQFAFLLAGNSDWQAQKLVNVSFSESGDAENVLLWDQTIS